MGRATEANFFAPLKNLSKIGQRGVHINAELILRRSKEHPTFRKEAENRICLRLVLLKGKSLIKAENLLQKLYQED